MEEQQYKCGGNIMVVEGDDRNVVLVVVEGNSRNVVVVVVVEGNGRNVVVCSGGVVVGSNRNVE